MKPTADLVEILVVSDPRSEDSCQGVRADFDIQVDNRPDVERIR